MGALDLLWGLTHGSLQLWTWYSKTEKIMQEKYATQELNRLNAKVVLVLYMTNEVFRTLLNQLNVYALSPPVRFVSESPPWSRS